MISTKRACLHTSGLLARCFALSMVVAWGFSPVAYAQSHSPTMGNMQEMMKGIGGMFGVDMEEMQDLSREERNRKMKEAAEKLQSDMNTNLEKKLGMNVDAFKALDKDEARALFQRRMGGGIPGQGQDRLADVLNTPRPAPRHGFPDGSVAVPIADGKIKLPDNLESKRQDLFLIAVDSWEREIVWRLNAVKGGQIVNLKDIDAPQSSLLLEVVDPQTRRVVKRLRPVSSVAEN